MPFERLVAVPSPFKFKATANPLHAIGGSLTRADKHLAIERAKIARYLRGCHARGANPPMDKDGNPESGDPPQVGDDDE